MKKISVPNIEIPFISASNWICTLTWYKWFELITTRINITDSGWTASTGPVNKGPYATYAGHVCSVIYVQAEAQATDDATKAVSQRLKALEDAVRAMGGIN